MKTIAPWILLLTVAAAAATRLVYATNGCDPISALGFTTSAGITLGDDTATDPRIQTGVVRFLDLGAEERVPDIVFDEDGWISGKAYLLFMSDLASVFAAGQNELGVLMLGPTGMTDGAWLGGYGAPAQVVATNEAGEIVARIAAEPNGDVTINLGGVP